MSFPFISNSVPTGVDMAWSQDKHNSLLQGDILVQGREHTAWGGAVTASMYLPLGRKWVWQQLIDYPRWVQYFPDITKSEILRCQLADASHSAKLLYQAAHKSFFFFTAQVEIYLNVVEELGQRIQFKLEKGTFQDFSADIKLQDWEHGTLLTYTVQATPNIPIPSIFIQQAMNFELPANMRKMRQVLCQGVKS